MPPRFNSRCLKHLDAGFTPTRALCPPAAFPSGALHTRWPILRAAKMRLTAWLRQGGHSQESLRERDHAIQLTKQDRRGRAAIHKSPCASVITLYN
jgi:hypothetical protein